MHLSYLFLAAVVWMAVLLFLRAHRLWPLYFVWGAVGLTLLLIAALRGSAVEHKAEQAAAWLLHLGLARLGLDTYLFERAAGAILIFWETEGSWTAANIDIECSGVLESCVFWGLVAFYPSFTVRQRVFWGLAGGVIIFLANLLRLFVIVTVIALYGRRAIYIAHTIAGRLVFFFLISALYWLVFSQPTLELLRRRLGG